MRYRCPECGAWVTTDDTVCPVCGLKLDKTKLRLAEVSGLALTLGPKFKNPVLVYIDGKLYDSLNAGSTLAIGALRSSNVRFLFGLMQVDYTLTKIGLVRLKLDYDRMWGQLTLSEEA